MGSRGRARGFGISATRDLRQACEIARAVQGLGYRTVWTNDLPGADGLVVAKAMADATSTIRIGVGAVPCDRRAPSELASRLSSLSIPPDRLVLIVGAGFSARPLEAVADALAHLRDRNGDALTLGVAAMGPRMCRLGGRLGDVVLLNWMTPERLAWAREKIDQGARARPPDLPPVEVAAYVRAAIGPGASHLIAEEAGRYA
ncbi:MAG: LLM class flavin-dependent oxidoreductase, partial [Actinomycetota bacterium]